MPKTIITGAAGFIGSHLCETLLRAGHDVVGVDIFDDFYDPAVKRRNIATCIEHGRFTLVEADIRDEKRMAALIDDGVDCIVHLAARAGVRPSIEQPLLYQDVNVRGTVALLEACKNRPTCKFIFGSSSSVYGNNKKVPFAETDPVDHPISPYAATKKAGELLCHTYHHLYGFPLTCLRFFTVYGPRQRPDLAIHKFVRLIEAGRPIPVFGDGTMKRDFTYIDDIIAGLMACVAKPPAAGKDKPPFKLYNIGNNASEPLMRFISVLEKTLGKKAEVAFRPMQTGDVKETYADIAETARDFGFKPTTPIDVGLPKLVAWYRDYYGV
jgi:UDP-glucuronate 4-epimerase